jgi:hypothetical protein
MRRNERLGVTPLAAVHDRLRDTFFPKRRYVLQALPPRGARGAGGVK